VSKGWVGCLLLLVIALAVVLWWRDQQPGYFYLKVVNQSGQPVQQVLVGGSGALHSQSIEKLLAGATGQLAVELANSGELRVVVSQGLNRIDSLLVKDVGHLKQQPQQQSQQLTIYADNRFIFSAQD
jgi:hypothetical protein